MTSLQQTEDLHFAWQRITELEAMEAAAIDERIAIVQNLRDAGYSWRAIAGIWDISPQSCWSRFRDLIAPVAGSDDELS